MVKEVESFSGAVMHTGKWYQLTPEDVCEFFDTTEYGLTTTEAERRLQKYGHNVLAKTVGQSRFRLLLNQLQNPLIYILLIAGLLTVLLEHYTDSMVIFAVVILNSVVGFVQEYRAEEAMRRLSEIVAPKAKVVRDRVEFEVDSSQLVPGDIVLLSSGVKVPADVRLCRVKELRIDESLLTGESTTVEKTTDKIDPGNLTSGDQVNMAFMGTVVASGRGRGVVVETGASTQLGRISEDMKATKRSKTPLMLRMERFSKRIGIAILSLSILIFSLGTGLGEPILEMMLTAVSTAVSAIPEGLPAVLTITLSVGASRMAKRNAIIRKLSAVETLGSTTVICSDKTGTLTKNEMTVTKVFTFGRRYDVTGIGYKPEGKILFEGNIVKEDASLDLTLMIGLLCNESEVYCCSEDGFWKVSGDPMEAALLVSAMKRGIDLEDARRRYQRLDFVPFESERGYMATLHEFQGRKTVFLKGAPEKVCELFKSACNVQGEVEPCRCEQLFEEADKLAAEGLRVLAMAYKEVPDETREITHESIEEGGLIFAGFQAMIDPPRPDAVEAVEQCRRAGIRVIMVTGDYPVTARAIAQRMGIVQGTEVIAGEEMERISDEELGEKVERVSVFARVSPHHKLRVVKALQERGEIVAVTGDGVNDATALKAAHIGAAMGITGTDVAREASHMVLTDDNFSSIFAAVREGRVVFENIRKVTLFLVSTGVGEVLTILAALLLRFPLPFLPAQILWINLVTNGLQDVALAFEPGEKRLERRRPRDPKEGILSGLAFRMGLAGVFLMTGVMLAFWWELMSGASLVEARSVALTTMVFFQFFYVFVCRSETRPVFAMNPLSNRFLFLSVAAAFVAQLLVLYHPTLQFIFHTAPIPFQKLGWVLMIAASILFVETEKIVRRRGETGTA